MSLCIPVMSWGRSSNGRSNHCVIWSSFSLSGTLFYTSNQQMKWVQSYNQHTLQGTKYVAVAPVIVRAGPGLLETWTQDLQITRKVLTTWDSLTSWTPWSSSPTSNLDSASEKKGRMTYKHTGSPLHQCDCNADSGLLMWNWDCVLGSQKSYNGNSWAFKLPSVKKICECTLATIPWLSAYNPVLMIFISYTPQHYILISNLHESPVIPTQQFRTKSHTHTNDNEKW